MTEHEIFPRPARELEPGEMLLKTKAPRKKRNKKV